MPKIRDLRSYFWSKAEFASNGCIEWSGSLTDGYGYVKYRYRSIRTNRLAWELTNGPIPAGLYVLHDCDNRKCVSPAHLRLGTHADNMRDKVERGRAYTGVQKKGEAAHRAKLTEAQAREIKSLPAPVNLKALGEKYGVAPVTVWRVRTGVTWPHLQATG